MLYLPHNSCHLICKRIMHVFEFIHSFHFIFMEGPPYANPMPGAWGTLGKQTVCLPSWSLGRQQSMRMSVTEKITDFEKC